MPTEIELKQELLFPSGIYYFDLPVFLEDVKKVSAKSFHKIDPVIGAPSMSDQFAHDPDIKEFSQELLEVSHYILDKCGYKMSDFVTYFSAMWTQHHDSMSMMEQHVHGHGDQLVGFYCLEAPTDCGRVVFHDPRPGKVQINLPQENMMKASLASDAVNFEMIPGRVIIAPAWLPHSVTRNLNKKKAAKFVHFNIGVRYQPKQECVCTPPVEVV